jgi:putative cell wall-binding protein
MKSHRLFVVLAVAALVASAIPTAFASSPPTASAGGLRPHVVHVAMPPQSVDVAALPSVERGARRLESPPHLGRAGGSRNDPARLATPSARLATPVIAATTATTTTLQIINNPTVSPAWTQVSATVSPPPQVFNGFIPAVAFYVDGNFAVPAPLGTDGVGSTTLSASPGSHQVKAVFQGLGDYGPSESAPQTLVVVAAGATPSPSAIDFGTTAAGSALSRTVTISSTGTSPLHVTSTSITGAVGSFAVTADACTGASVAPGSSCSITVAFDPPAYVVEPIDGSLDWIDDTPAGSGHVPLTGADVPAVTTPLASTAGAPPNRGPVTLTGAGDGACVPAPCLEPPDPIVAVGPNHVVEATNRSVRVLDRSGTILKEVSLGTFFNEPAGQILDGDPRIAWDTMHGRWIATEISADASTSYLYLAVSTSSDPMGTWITRAWYAPGIIGDFPGLGFSSDKIVLSTNDFQWSSGAAGSYDGADVLVVDAAAAFSSGALPFGEFTSNPSYFSFRPAVARSAGSALHAVVGIDSTAVSLDLGYATVTGSVASGTLIVSAIADLTSSGPSLPALVDPPTPAALAGSDPPFGAGPTDATWANGVLWFPSTSFCVPPGSLAARSCARVTGFTTGGTPTKVQDFLIGGPTIDTFVPGLAVDGAGDLFAGWSQAAAGARGPISTLVSYRLGSDPNGALRTPIVASTGAGTYPGHRWGDYLGIAPEPIDPRGVWTPAPASRADGSWSTDVVKVSEAGPIRLAGPDRFSTAAMISAATFAPGPDVAYIAYAYNFPDALAGAAAAGTVKGPVLLADTNLPLDPATTAELSRLHPGRIVVLGSAGVVSDGVKNALASYTTGGVTRLAGPDRFATAAAISAATFAPGTGVAYIAVATNFPDALAGAAAAGTIKGPVLLVDTNLPLNPSTTNELARLHPGRIIVLGSAGVISDAVKTALGAYTSGGVTRLSGPDRFATAAAVSAATFSAGVARAYIAYAYNFPDALAGAAAAGTIAGPVLLVDTIVPLSSSTAAELARLKPHSIAILGSQGVVSDGVVQAVGGYIVP